MAFTSFSATPTHTEWNELFTDLAARLNAADIESTERRAFVLPVVHWDGTSLNSGTAEKLRSTYFTAPMDKRLYAISIDGHVAGGAQVWSCTLSPTVSDFLLAQGVEADYPAASLTPGGTGIQQESDYTLVGSRPTKVRRGGQYKLVGATTGSGTSFGFAALFTTSGKRV